MKKLIFAVATLAISSAAFATNLAVRVQFQQFHWEESLDGEGKVLDEDGPLFGFDLGFTTPMNAAWALDGRVGLFAGEVDYDGQTQAGDPAETTTEYFGMSGEASARFTGKDHAGVDVDPFAGLGLRSWVRGIGTSEGDGRGYDEYWTMFYARTGLRAEGPLQGAFRWFGIAALRFPIYSENTVEIDFEDIPDEEVALEPGRQLTFDAEIGITNDRWTASLSYEQQKFDESDTEEAGPLLLFQPESEGYIASLNIGLIF